MNADRFVNALRILRSTDRHELERAIGRRVEAREWNNFVDRPTDWLMRAAEDEQERLLAYVETRQPKERIAA
ncbi:MAG: hypothetical protein AB7P02_05100 [Alphaproteobacteria bacterium]